MSEQAPEKFEYNFKNIFNVATFGDIFDKIGDKTKTATTGIISGTAVLPLLGTVAAGMPGYAIGGAVSTLLGLNGEKISKTDSGKIFSVGLGTGGKIATSVGLASLIPNIGPIGFLFAAFGTLGTLNILYHYFVNGKVKAEEIIEEEINKDDGDNELVNNEILEQEEIIEEKKEPITQEIINKIEESLKILVDGKEQKLSLEYIKNK